MTEDKKMKTIDERAKDLIEEIVIICEGDYDLSLAKTKQAMIKLLEDVEEEFHHRMYINDCNYNTLVAIIKQLKGNQEGERCR